jgi:hypothetical protein
MGLSTKLSTLRQHTTGLNGDATFIFLRCLGIKSPNAAYLRLTVEILEDVDKP